MHKSFLKPSQLPGGVYSSIAAIAAILAHTGLIKHNNQFCSHRYPFTPGWREAIMVKCLAEGHKHQGCSQDLNPHSDDSAIRTQIRCTKPHDIHVHVCSQLKIISFQFLKQTRIFPFLCLLETINKVNLFTF